MNLNYPLFNVDDFVRTWQKARNIDEVSKKFGITNAAARCRAWRLRKLGVKLKKFTAGIKAINVSKLNRIARKAA